MSKSNVPLSTLEFIESECPDDIEFFISILKSDISAMKSCYYGEFDVWDDPEYFESLRESILVDIKSIANDLGYIKKWIEKMKHNCD